MSVFIGALRTLILAAAVLQFSVIKITAHGPLAYEEMGCSNAG